ncbi:Low molecular weight protein antigen 6 [Pseudonocardia sp. Ae406_Ps2]|uniref:PH domain-containing protein n=1 Tax=unclassified Pseudonocardia TaxID=2619320 RepID=UPI0002F63427|nr:MULTISPECIES: PH domain-containing protein [unclassified Pseudonocardia]OLL97127.1 Low molecular weight protein antigen 6 [Pseudonocardia sp. Ae331_Ps2]OLM05163.1 Low molecular weight protein antigen 6 [Pseudonocardia sp. Ae406_Ps2]OLM10021.1 Low molecular weight protein antigen 6 [Pseudonocardia sp. Ae505_Ps2]OLM26734.1 Low molecular weight protein antigen 6 [Pseudonocardia sp. Ae706_Ps2]
MSSTDDHAVPADTTSAAAPRATAASQQVDSELAWTPRVRDEGRKLRVGSRALVFKPSRLTIFAILVAVVGSTPLVFSLPWFWVVLVLPVAAIAWILRVRTTVDPETLTVRSAFSSRTVDWDDVRGLRIGSRSRVSAVLGEDDDLVLPAVHARDLPALSVASGGRFADPAAVTEPEEDPAEGH